MCEPLIYVFTCRPACADTTHACGSLYRLLTAKSIILSERLIGRGGKMFVGYRFRILAANSERASQWTRRLACIKS
jgi:hypothetical protein